MSSGATIGKNWTYKIYFDPDADKKSNDGIHSIDGRELMTKLLPLVGVDEDIKTVSSYKCRLTSWQWTMACFYHMFVIFETKSFFWSIEKNSEGITIQRSKNERDVKDNYRQKDRLCDVAQMKSARGQKSVHDLINWLCDTHELYSAYFCLTNNCKSFANAVFNKVALETSWCYVIKFRPEADQEYIIFNDDELMTTLVSLVDVKEDILNVFLYEGPTYPKLIMKCIFQTNAWWWSIENRLEIMIITRNKKESEVKQHLDRNGSCYQKRKSACGTKSVYDLIDWLYNKKELKKLHSYIILTTETFANEVFAYVSDSIDDEGTGLTRNLVNATVDEKPVDENKKNK